MEILAKDKHVIAIWWSLKAMIDHNIQTPFGKKKIVSLMAEVAEKQKTTNKEYKLKLSEDDFKICWDCIKTVLDNNLILKEQLPTFKETFEKVAIAIDTRFLTEIVRPVEVAPSLKIVDGGKK